MQSQVVLSQKSNARNDAGRMPTARGRGLEVRPAACALRGFTETGLAAPPLSVRARKTIGPRLRAAQETGLPCLTNPPSAPLGTPLVSPSTEPAPTYRRESMDRSYQKHQPIDRAIKPGRRIARKFAARPRMWRMDYRRDYPEALVRKSPGLPLHRQSPRLSLRDRV